MAQESLLNDEDELMRDEEVPGVALGTAGWSYDDWNGVFYPRGLTPSSRLRYYSRRFRTVEVDSTFYAAPALSTVQRWREETPDDFVFAAKFPKAITHDRRLVNCGLEAVAFAETMSELGAQLGPLLIQLPPSLCVRAFEDLKALLEGLPDGLMYAVEVRHRSWLIEEFADLLKSLNVALCLTCSGGHLEKFWRVTARFSYIRWLGSHDSFERFDRRQADRSSDIQWWVPRIRHLTDHGGFVFGYVNNHYEGHSPATLQTLTQALQK